MKGHARSKLLEVLFVILAIPSIFYLTSAHLQGQELTGFPNASAQVPTPCPDISTDTVLTYSCVVDSHYSGITINQGVTLTINPGVTITSYNDITAYGNIVNHGTINFQASRNFYVYSTLTNYNNIIISNYAQLVNYGTVSNYGGTITNSYSGVINGGLLNNNGTVDNIFATFQNNQGGVINNNLHGTFINSLGNLFNYGTINNSCGAVFTNTGSIYSNPVTFASCFATTAAIIPNTSSTSTGSILVFNATIADTSSTPTTPQGTISWNDGSAGGKFANSATCILSGSGTTSSCTISYTAPLSAKSVVITAQYAGDSAHSPSSATSHLTVIAPDTVAPTTTATLAGTAGTNGWYTSQVTATIAASDNPGGSGVKSTSYSLDGSTPTAYTAPVIVTGDTNHTLSFNSTDKAGNAELPHLIYIPIDTTPPVITVPTDVTKEAKGPLTRAFLGTATAIDAVDGPVTVTSNATAKYPVGTTIIQYSAADLAGNTASAFQHVIITDTTPPSLQLPDQITAQATGSSGAIVSYKANATDLVDGPVTPVCNPPSGSTFAYGNTAVTCTATDSHDNTATGAFDVNVQNKIPPTISITSPAQNAIVSSATVVVSGTASDIVSVSNVSWKVDSGTVSAVSGITPGTNIMWSFATSNLAPGPHTIQVNATDSAGLVAISQISITYAAPTVTIPVPQGGGQLTFRSGGGGFTNLASVSQSSLPSQPPPGNYPLGFFAWDITGFAPATSVTVDVTSPVPLAHQSQYFKLIGNTWVPIPVTVLGNTMRFSITDNGPYDSNLSAGIISDPATVAAPTDGRITGGGNIGKGTNFGFEIYSDLSNAHSIQGTFEYHDRYVRLDLESNKINFLSVDPTGTQATFVGTGTYDRHDKHDAADTFLVSVTDPDKRGTHDTFSITVTDSSGNIVYQNSGVTKGHIEIHHTGNDDNGKNGNDSHRKN